MKLIYTIAIIFFALSTNAQLTNGLVAHWNFNGNVNDATGNGHNGTITGTITPATGKAGLANTAMFFPGNGNYVTVPHSNSFNVNNYTICVVVKPTVFFTGTCQGNVVIVRGPSAPGHWGINLNDNPYNDCTVADTNKYVFTPYVGNTNPTPSSLQYTPSTRTNTWYCVVATFDGSNARLYVNSQLKATYPAGPVGSSTDPIGIGRDLFAGSHTFPFTGLIDEIRFYNRALSQVEIDSFCNLFNAPAIEPEVSISQPVNPTSFCPADKFILHYTVTAPFNTGNTFTAQLSDATGSFATPVNIGSVTATGAGTINCTIPANTPAGTGYRVRVTASNPAKTSTDNGVNLTVFDAPKITLSGDTSVCIGDTLRFYAQVTPLSAKINWTGPNGFSDIKPNFTIAGAGYSDTGRYILSADNGGCIARDTITAIVGDVDFDLGSDTVLCDSDILVLTPGVVGAKYVWQDGNTNPSYNVSVAGIYHVYVTLGSCFKRDTINVDVQSIEMQLPADTTLCKDAQFTISIIDTFDSYLWSTGSAQSFTTVDNKGLYWLKVSKGDCFAADSMEVKLLEPYFHLGNDTTLCNGRTFTLRPNTIEGSLYHWQDGSTKDFFVVKEKGFYHVTVTNVCGTFGSNIQVDYIQCECYPVVPNVFTPNKDGLNDAIGPLLTCIPAKFKYVIANRWGQIVFETEDYQKKWDGRQITTPAPLGTYFYFIQITDRLGNNTMHKGDILLLR